MTFGMRWGLVPLWWSKPLKELRLATFNARLETVTTKPFFREPFKTKRCLMPVSEITVTPYALTGRSIAARPRHGYQPASDSPPRSHKTAIDCSYGLIPALFPRRSRKLCKTSPPWWCPTFANAARFPMLAQ